MNKGFFVLAVALMAAPGSILAAPSTAGAGLLGVSEAGHGGGCRKDSPPGQCCHAGSQPYHCH